MIFALFYVSFFIAAAGIGLIVRWWERPRFNYHMTMMLIHQASVHRIMMDASRRNASAD